jgi:hypothetical protein
MRLDLRLRYLGLLLLSLLSVLSACGPTGTCVERTSPFVCGEDYTRAECDARHGTWHGDTPCSALH